MQRQEGYYWVKHKDCGWHVAYYSINPHFGNDFTCHFFPDGEKEKEFEVINESRLLSPDEETRAILLPVKSGEIHTVEMEGHTFHMYASEEECKAANKGL